MHTTIDLQIAPNKPTKKGNVWTSKACNTVVDQINKRATRSPMKCHFMERSNLTPIGKPAFELVGAEIDKNIKIHIRTLDTLEGKLLEALLKSGKVECLPIIEAGTEQPLIIDGKQTITEIKRLVGIGANADLETRTKLGV